MCGIVGVIGEDANDKVLRGLKTLEYRGYDSWGIGYLEENELKIQKQVGKISEIKSLKADSQIAIGHTRWATHGGVTELNAHPQFDCQKTLAVVHNGIIENYQELRKELTNLGHRFVSQTDTEVIPHLIEENLKRYDIFNSILKTCQKLEGNFALVVLKKNDSKLYAVSNGCPLAIGIDTKIKCIASDILAFPGVINKAIFLKDQSIAEVGDEIKIFDAITGNKKRIETKKITSTYKNVNLKNFKHFLFKEICEQPDIISKISIMDQREIETNAALIRNSFGTFLVACGTAFHAALIGKYLFSKNAKMHINIDSAGEFPNFQDFLTSKTLLFAISQSGETADVLEAVKVAKIKKTKIISLVNNPNSTLARVSNVVMITPAGPEIAVLSTKAFTSQTAILFLLSHAICNDLEGSRKILQRCALGIKESLTVENISKVQKLAKLIKNSEHLFTIGRSLNYPTALEAALKIKEVSYIHAEGFSGADLKHGPIALIEKDVPCIVFVSEDKVKNDIISNAMEVKARGGYIIGVAPKNNEVFDYWIKVPDVPEISPIVNIIPMQVLAYYLAVEKGLDPDKPRNLAKSVTVK